MNGPGFAARIPTISLSRQLDPGHAVTDVSACVTGQPLRCHVPDAAAGDVNHVGGAVQRQQRRCHGAALPRGADHGHRPARIDPLGDPGHVVVGHVDRAGNVPLVPLLALAHVEHLQLLAARVQRRDVDSRERLRRQRQRKPGMHPALQVAGDLVDPDGHSELRRVGGVRVTLSDEHDLLVAAGDPRKLGPEPGAHRGIAHRSGDVGRVIGVVVADVDEQRARCLLALDVAGGKCGRIDGRRCAADRG